MRLLNIALHVILFVLFPFLGNGKLPYLGADTDGQNAFNAIDSLVSVLHKRPQIHENIYMHVDNQCYFKGDTLWYKAYVVRSDNMHPTDISKVLYVELLTPDGYLVERQQLHIDEGGTANGQFALSDSLYSGYYELRSYTRWMLNFNYTIKEHKSFNRQHFYNKQFEDDYFRVFEGLYSRVFPIYEKPSRKGNFKDKRIVPRPKQRMYSDAPRLNVSFYPEGGKLVKGMESRVAFEVTDESGKAVMINGYLKDSTIIKPGYMGRGTFMFTPNGSNNYAMFTYMGKNYKFPLPKPEKDGCVVNYDCEKQLLTLNANIPLGAISFMHHGRCQHFERLQPDARQFSIKDIRLNTGINEIIVYGKDAEPLASRLIFINNGDVGKRLNVELPEEISAYEHVPFNVHCPDSGSLRTVSISVRDCTDDDMTYNDGNILTELLLTGELKGFVASPTFYFNNNQVVHDKELDVLMMVQGWRKYKRVAQGRYLPEKGLAYEGQVLPISENLSDENDFIGKALSDNDNNNNNNTKEDKGKDNDSDETETKEENDDEYDYDLEARKHKKRIKKSVLAEAEVIINGEVFGETQKIDKNGYFKFILPEFDGQAILFITAYNEKDSLKKSLKSRGDRNMMKDRYPDFYIKRNMFFPQYTLPYSWYQVNMRDPLDDQDFTDETFSQYSLDKVNVLPTVKARKLRKSKHSLDMRKPAIVWDAYKLYNDVVDAGLCQGVYDPNDFALQASIFLFGYMEMPDEIKVRGIVDGTTYMKNCALGGWEYAKPKTSFLLMKYLQFKRANNFRIYSDFDKRKGISLERDGGPAVTLVIDLLPNDGTRYVYRDRRYVFPGYSYTMEFYSPDYSQQTPSKPTDYRRTLYWNPNAEIDANGNFKDAFYGNSHECKLAISACGIGDDGQIYYTE